MQNAFVARDVFSLFPSYRRIVIIARDIDNSGEHYELAQMMAEVRAQLRNTLGLEAESIPDHPAVANWRAAFRAFGVDPDEQHPSVQALLGSVLSGRSISYYNTVVAISNLISLKYLLPSGADDIDKTVGDFGLRLAKGNEVFVAFDSSDVTNPKPGEIILADDEKVMCRSWVWRQGIHTQVDTQSRNILINIDVLPPTSIAVAEAAAKEMADLVNRFCGGVVTLCMLSSEHLTEAVPPSINPRVQETNVYDTLELRGYIQRTSDRAAVRDLLGDRITIYQGFDPTAPSLHVAHLMSLMVWKYLQDAGHSMVFILGAGTARIGDPSGRDSARPIITVEEVQRNAAAIQQQVQGIGLVDFEAHDPDRPDAILLDNSEWLDMPTLTYAREVTRYFSVNELIKRDTFRKRLEQEENLSLLEFLYTTLQGYDFEYLYEKYNCVLQIGGNDQWANILDGMDLIRRKCNGKAYAMVFPLLMDRSGQKMGKTAAGEKIWLAPSGAHGTSPFQFYQYWVSCPDEDVERNFKLFTFLSVAEIRDIMRGHPRDAQHRLAYEITKIVHGEDVAQKVQRDARRVFGSDQGMAELVPTIEVDDARLAAGLTIPQVLMEARVAGSLSEGKSWIRQKALKLNNVRVDDIAYRLSASDFVQLEGEDVAMIRYGKGKVLKVIRRA
ncbi:MAG: tyrosine--tRNA ligase [Chloroflexi bacterium]|nr:tyrosine--tRNA ligase [Chloroflexota bacterium]